METYFIVTAPTTSPAPRYAARVISFKILVDDDVDKWRILRIVYHDEATFVNFDKTNDIWTVNCKSRIIPEEIGLQ